MASLLQNASERVKDLRAGAESLGKGRGANRHHHELLKVHAAVGVRTAVQDVHHRHRDHVLTVGGDASADRGQVRIQRLLVCGGVCADRGHRDGQQGVRAQTTLGRSPIELDQRLVDGALIQRHAFQRVGDGGVDVLDRLAHAFAEIPFGITVAQFERFARARRCA